MKKDLLDSTITKEEKRTVKWFLMLFYSISLFFDLSYYYLLPKYIYNTQVGLPGILGYWIYVLLFCLLPFSYYMLKTGKQHLIKYIYFISYTLLEIINETVTFWGTSFEYRMGNVAEVFLILFCPIFVNRRYFWLVSFGTTLKYLLIGSILQTTEVFFPLILVIVLSIISYILLNHFLGYVKAVEKSYDRQLKEIVKGVIATLELKDPYTKGHSERVAIYAIELAKETGNFTCDEIKAFNYACLLHDIGKINIPDQILMKPGKLTKEEFLIIKSHPVVGAKVVENVEGLNNNISVIRSHHERWDGKGYPDMLQGEQIPLLARITAVADAFDAMTSSRSYRSALSVQEAYKRIIEGEGTQFDPGLIDIFKKVYPSWAEYHKSYFLPKDNTKMLKAQN